MGNIQSMKKINYEDMQTVTKNPEIYLIINTLSPSDQKCLIVNTTVAEEEEILINNEYESSILDLIDNRDEFTRSDLQGCVGAVVLKIVRETKERTLESIKE